MRSVDIAFARHVDVEVFRGVCGEFEKRFAAVGAAKFLPLIVEHRTIVRGQSGVRETRADQRRPRRVHHVVFAEPAAIFVAGAFREIDHGRRAEFRRPFGWPRRILGAAGFHAHEPTGAAQISKAEPPSTHLIEICLKNPIAGHATPLTPEFFK